MSLIEYTINHYDLVNNYYNKKTSNEFSKENITNAISLKLNYNIACTSNLVSILDNKLYDIINKALFKLYNGISNTFYPNFPEDVPDDDLILLINQIHHYITGDLTPLIETEHEISTTDVSSTIIKKLKATPLKTLDVKEDTFKYILEDLLSSSKALNAEDYQALHTIIHHIYQPDNIDSTNRYASMVALHALLLRRSTVSKNIISDTVKTLSDVAKYIKVCISYKYHHTLVYEPSFYKDSKGLSRYDTNCIMRMIHHVSLVQDTNNFDSDLKLNLDLFKSFVLTNKAKISSKYFGVYLWLNDLIFSKLNSVYNRIDNLATRGDYNTIAIEYPSLFIRNYISFKNNSNYSDNLLSNRAIDSLSGVPVRMLLQLYNRLNRKDNTPLVYDTSQGLLFKGSYSHEILNKSLISNILKNTLKPIVTESCHDIYNILVDEYKKSAEQEETFAEYCDKFKGYPKIDYALCTSNKDTTNVKSIPYSVFKLPNTTYLSVYTKWTKNNDVDLAINACSSDGRLNCSYYYPSTDVMVHSGDITCTDGHTPVSERIICDLDKLRSEGYQYLMVNVFSYGGLPLNEVNGHLGLQSVDSFTSKLGNNHEDTIYDSIFTNSTTATIPVVIDLQNNNVIILNKNLNTKESMRNSENMGDIGTLLDYIASISNTNLSFSNLGDFLELSNHERDIISLASHCPDLAHIILDKI